MRATPLASLCFFLILFLFPSPQQPQPSAPPVHQTSEQRNREKKANKTDQNKTVSGEQAAATGNAPETKPQREQEHTPSYDPKTDTLYRGYLSATIVGVAGGIFGLGILVWQSVLLRRTANAAIQSAEIADKTLKSLKTQADSTNIQFSEQLKVMNEQLSAMQSQVSAMQSIAEASRRSADATHRSIEVLVAFERPWVDVRLVGHGGPIYYLHATNHGRTAAKITRYSLVWEFPNSEIPTSDHIVTQTRLLGANEDWQFEYINLHRDLTADRLEKIKRGDVGFILRGAIYYADVTDLTLEHESTFYYFYDHAGQALTPIRDPRFRQHT